MATQPSPFCVHYKQSGATEGAGIIRLLTFVLKLVSSNRCEGKRVPLSDTVALGSGPDVEGLDVMDMALSCSSRDRRIPSP